MFQKIKDKIRQVMYKMGLIKGIEKITDRKEVSINKEMYVYIDIWEAIYSCFHEPWHDIQYNTVDGVKKRTMATLGVAKTVSAEMASLIYNEKCSISISHEPTAEYIADVLKNNSFNKKF